MTRGAGQGCGYFAGRCKSLFGSSKGSSGAAYGLTWNNARVLGCLSGCGLKLGRTPDAELSPGPCRRGVGDSDRRPHGRTWAWAKRGVRSAQRHGRRVSVAAAGSAAGGQAPSSCGKRSYACMHMLQQSSPCSVRLSTSPHAALAASCACKCLCSCPRSACKFPPRQLASVCIAMVCISLQFRELCISCSPGIINMAREFLVASRH